MEQEHIDQELSKESLKMISETHVAWEKSKEQIWADMEKKLIAAQIHEPKVVFMPWMKIALAASIILLLGIPVIMQQYTRTLVIPMGEHSSITLPDNSTVKLNAQSTLSYKPLLYRFSRQIKFDGEAYFIVQPGKKFEVVSTRGTTFVLGTSFNVYSRDKYYRVTCVTGKVKVAENKAGSEIVLNPGEKAELNPEGLLEVQSEINPKQTLSWLQNRFSFTSIPLATVFEEIGRQYGVKITITGELDKRYTGTFNKSDTVDNVLILVCRPFNLKFTRKSADEYIISWEN